MRLSGSGQRLPRQKVEREILYRKRVKRENHQKETREGRAGYGFSLREENRLRSPLSLELRMALSVRSYRETFERGWRSSLKRLRAKKRAVLLHLLWEPPEDKSHKGNVKCQRETGKNGMMEYWNIGLRKNILALLALFHHSNFPFFLGNKTWIL